MSLLFPFPSKPEGFKSVQVDENIFWFRLPLPMALNHVNVYAISEPEGWTIIDTGFFTSLTVRLWENIIEKNFEEKPILRVIVTHYHPDHIGMAGWFKKNHGSEIYTSRVSWLFARMLTLDAQDRPSKESFEHLKEAGINQSKLDQFKNSRPFNFADCVHPIPLGYRRLHEGNYIEMGGRRWFIRFGNGHAPEHLTFWSEDGEICIGADQFLPDITSNIGVFATEPDANPLKEWLDSCEAFGLIADEDILVLPGHKAPFKKLKTRIGELIDHHSICLRNLENFLSRPKKTVDCFDAVFGRAIPEKEFGLALAETNAHLNYLLDKNKIIKFKKDGINFWEKSP